jgi:hypothetical protein
VPDEISTGCAVHRDDNEGNYDNGQDHVSDQNHKIKGTNYTLPLEGRITMIVVVGQIGNQETSRRYQGRDLTVSVRADESVPNKTVAQYQEQEAGGVQKGVQMREVGNVFRHSNCFCAPFACFVNQFCP